MGDRGALVSGNGALTANPEVRQAGSTNVANFTLAFNWKWGKGDQQRKEVAFVECEAWGWLADWFANNTVKGNKVTVSGRIVQKSWEHEGKKRSKLVLKVEDADLIQKTGNGNGNGSGQPKASATGDQGGSSGQPAQSGQADPVGTEVPREDIPF